MELFRAVLAILIRPEGLTFEITIGELIAASRGMPGAQTPDEAAGRALRRIGLRVDGDELWIANDARLDDRLPANLRNGWRERLLRLEGAHKCKKPARINLNGPVARYIVVPLIHVDDEVVVGAGL